MSLVQPTKASTVVPSRPVPGQTSQDAAALPGGAAGVYVPLRGSGKAWAWSSPLCASPPLPGSPLQAWKAKPRTPEIHKTGWSQEPETQETPGSQGLCLWESVWGRTPINICNPLYLLFAP